MEAVARVEAVAYSFIECKPDKISVMDHGR